MPKAADPDEKFLAEIKALQATCTVYKTWRTLHPKGLSRSRDAFRKWCKELIAAGKLNAWPAKDRRGRPQGKLKRSLDLLDAIDDPDRPAADLPLTILHPAFGEPPSNVAEMVFGSECLDVPCNKTGEPDFAAYARRLGARRTKTLGDMDFYLLARWTAEFRGRRSSCIEEVWEINKDVLKRAYEIRSEMLDALKSKRGRRRKT